MNDRWTSDAGAGGTSVSQPSELRKSGTGGLVVVVDDDESVRDSFRILLESLGFTVKTYASGRDILRDGQCSLACCLIVDQHMPEMDGLTTLAALRRDGLGARTILVTGRLDAEITARAALLDVSAVLEKPVSTARLLDIIRTPLVGRHTNGRRHDQCCS